MVLLEVEQEKVEYSAHSDRREWLKSPEGQVYYLGQIIEGLIQAGEEKPNIDGYGQMDPEEWKQGVLDEVDTTKHDFQSPLDKDIDTRARKYSIAVGVLIAANLVTERDPRELIEVLGENYKIYTNFLTKLLRETEQS